jgi:hypothetical protein
MAEEWRDHRPAELWNTHRRIARWPWSDPSS